MSATETITVRVTKEQKEHLQTLADTEKRTISNYVKFKLNLL